MKSYSRVLGQYSYICTVVKNDTDIQYLSMSVFYVIIE